MVEEIKIAEGYKQTEVGVIPEDWDVKKIQDFTYATAGGTPSTSIKDFWGGKIKWMSSGELNNKRIYDVDGRITTLGLKSSAAKFIPANSVLIGLAGQGKTRATVAINYVELCTNQSIAAIFPNKEVETEYLYQNLERRYLELRNLSSGDGGRGGLNLRLIHNFKIPLPPTRTEQTAIATALSDMDSLIEGLEKLIAKKRNIKQGAMQELLKPKEGWSEKKLGDVFNFKQGVQCGVEKQKKEFKKGLVRFIRIIDLSQEGEPPRYIDDPGISHHIKIDDLFMVRYGNPGLLGFGYEGVIANNLFSLKPLLKIEKIFFYHLLSFKKDAVLELSSSTTMAAINFTSLKLLEMIYPKSLSEQIRIANILSDMDNEIEQLETKLSKYKMLKTGMMQELLTGKKRLNHDFKGL